jgi:hypothetical protein
MESWGNIIGARATKTVQKLVGGVDRVKSGTLSFYLWMCDNQWMDMVWKNDIVEYHRATTRIPESF